MTLLQVTGLRTAFATDAGSLTVVDDVSFGLDRGDVLGIVGESGSGKSMLGLSLTQLLPTSARIEAGSVLWDGVELVGLEERKLRGLRGPDFGMVFQDPMSSLNPSRRIGGQIAEVLRKHRDMSKDAARARAVELLEEVRVPDARERMHAYPHELSGGLCQRVMIAVAIACEPKLLIADEPTTALDATIQAEIIELLTSLRRRHRMALIVVSHDVRVVADLADRVAVMYAGEFVEDAPAAALFASPQHPYTEALLAAAPRLDDPDPRRTRLTSIPGRPPKLGRWGDACRFAPRCQFANGDACTETHPPLREGAPGHWVRSAHPRSERGGGANA